MNDLEALRFGNSDEDFQIERTPSHLEPLEVTDITAEPNGYKRPRMETEMDSLRNSVYELVDTVLQGHKLNKSYQRHYSNVESLCKLKYSEQSKLSGVISSKLKSAMTEVVTPRILSIISLESPLFEKEYIEIYDDWEAKLMLMSKLFLYLDRSYLMNPKRKRIYIQGINLFRESLLVEGTLTAAPTFQKYFTLLEGRREFGVYFEISQRFTSILVKLDYDNTLVLHNRLTEQILKHFNQLKEGYAPETYLKTVFVKISNEVEFFHTCGKTDKFIRALLLKLQWNLIFSEFSEHLRLALPQLLSDEKEELLTLYKICITSMSNFQYDSISVLLHEWSQVVNSSVIKIIELQKLNKNLVNLLVAEHVKCNGIIQQCFAGNDKFEFELRESFMKAFNNNKHRNSTILNHLCKYCDSFMKKADDLAFTEFLKNVLTLFKLINNKQDFLTRYKKDLSKRLLLYGKSDVEQEQWLVHPLLEIVGECDLKDGIETMFEDMKVSQNSYNKLVPPSFLTPIVLNKKYWPEIPKLYNDQIVLPSIFSNLLDEFTAGYQNSNEKFKNQLLDWSNYSLHQVILEVGFASGVKEISLNLLQAVVLLVFEDDESKTLQEIHNITKIELKFLVRVLNSLTLDRYKLLNTTKDGEFAFNYNFTDKSNKIKVPGVREIKEAVKFVDAVDKEVLRSRQNEFESAIVKICKSHKRISSVNLLNEAMILLNRRAPVELKDLKIAIDNLIDHEYLKRVTTDIFEYVP